MYLKALKPLGYASRVEMTEHPVIGIGPANGLPDFWLAQSTFSPAPSYCACDAGFSKVLGLHPVRHGVGGDDEGRMFVQQSLDSHEDLACIWRFLQTHKLKSRSVVPIIICTCLCAGRCKDV